jgi:acetyl/propionyl-CoA carboxylase alpha subunit
VISGQAVDVHYDPMLAKIVAKGRTREEARRRLVAALRETVALGVATNLSWLGRLLESDPVVRGETHTGLLEALLLPAPPPPPHEVFAAAASVLSGPASAAPGSTKSSWPGPFDTRFRMGGGA